MSIRGGRCISLRAEECPSSAGKQSRNVSDGLTPASIRALSPGGPSQLSAAFLPEPGDYHAHAQSLRLHRHPCKLTTPPASPRILPHTPQGKIAGIYCDKPAKILEIETQEIERILAH